VDVEQALSDLTEISSQVEQAVVLDDNGAIVGSTFAGGDRLGELGMELLAQAESAQGRRPRQLEAATHDGSVFVLQDGGRTIVATTPTEPTVGLVFYDLKSCLAAISQPEKPKRRRKTRAKAGGAADAA
jgi:hypothetical protein